MKLIIKSIITGESCAVNVEDTSTIFDIKKKIELETKIPSQQQTLVLFGKTLQDEKTVASYPKIKDGTKLYMAVKKPDTLDAALTRFLRQYYTDQQCERIVNEFMRDFHSKVGNLSLDDLERIAKVDMENCNKFE